MSRMSAAETRALWSRVTPEQVEAATRIAVRFFSGQDLEVENTQTPAETPEDDRETDRANDRAVAPLTLESGQ